MTDPPGGAYRFRRAPEATQDIGARGANPSGVWSSASPSSILVSLVALAVTAASVGPAGASFRDAYEQLPNLVPAPPFDVRIERADGSAVEPALRFSVAVANRGDHAFDLFGKGEDVSGGRSVAEQCVAWATHRACTQRRAIGYFVWHPEHGHHHFEDFALYELRTFRRNGAPRMGKRGLVRSGGKVSFCLMDIDQDDEGPSHPLYWMGHPLYMSCVAGTGFQGISPGWRDVYSWRLEGQQVVLDDVPDGTYALVVTTDPDGRILETDKGDNVAVAGIRLSEGGTEVEVVCQRRPPDLRCRPRGTSD